MEHLELVPVEVIVLARLRVLAVDAEIDAEDRVVLAGGSPISVQGTPISTT
jgi:hypothetical protein